MRYKIVPILSSILFTMAGVAHAETSVTISNNGEGSNSHVTVNSNVQGSSTTQVTNKTHVQIETNGTTKTFDTNGSESVNWSSDDGTAKVTINSKSATNNPAIHTPTPTISRAEKIASSTPHPKKTMENSTSRYSFIEKYFSWFKSFFSH